MTLRTKARRGALALAAAAVLALTGCPGPDGAADGGGAGGRADAERSLAGRLDDARALFDLAQKLSIDRRIETLEQIVRDYPESEVLEEALLRLALDYYARTRLEEAERTCHTIINLFPKSPHVFFPLQFILDRARQAVDEAGDALARAAAEARRSGTLSDVLRFLEERTAGGSPASDPLAWAYRVRVHAMRSDSEAVIRDATALADAFPSLEGDARNAAVQGGVLDALEERARALAERGAPGDREAAIADLERVIGAYRSSPVLDLGVEKRVRSLEEKLGNLRLE